MNKLPRRKRFGAVDGLMLAVVILSLLGLWVGYTVGLARDNRTLQLQNEVLTSVVNKHWVDCEKYMADPVVRRIMSRR